MLKYDSFLNHIFTTETSFQTLENFDTKITDLIKGDLEIVKYIIDDNKLYYNCFQNCTPYAKDFTKYFNSIVEKNPFKNTLFYLFSHEGLDPYEVRNITSSETLNLLEKVPAFIFNRDTNKRFEKNKYLLPDPYLIGPDNLAIADSWGEVVDMITSKS